MSNHENNPYETPKAEGIVNDFRPIQHSEMELASRWTRLGAAIIDSFLLLPLILILGVLLDIKSLTTAEPMGMMQSILMSILAFLLFVLLQGYFLKNNGQTIGKKLLKIKIVTMDGQLPDFLSLLSKRYAAFYAINLIPFIGGLINFVNILFIFREDRRCLHDLLAGTCVIKCE